VSDRTLADEQKSLVGKTIMAVHLAEDKMAIKFDLTDGSSVVAKCDADCCSHTWIEHIENPEFLIGSPIQLAEDVPMPEPAQPDDYGLIQSYGFRMRTAKGDVLLEYRNESNGYYGGSLSWPWDRYFYGGVGGGNVSSEEWKQIA
jgi:hypothetical protein